MIDRHNRLLISLLVETAYGFAPTPAWWEMWDTSTEEAQDKQFYDLVAMINDGAARSPAESEECPEDESEEY